MSPARSHLKAMTTKTGALVATGLVASSIFASMPASNAVDTGSFGTVISATDAQTTTRTVPVDNTALLAAVEEARAAGITVNEEAIKKLTVGSTSEVTGALAAITADHQGQAEALKQLITEYAEAKKQAEADHAAALVAWEQAKADTDARNATLKDEYEAKVAKYQEDLAAYEAKAAAYQKLIEALENNGDVDTEEFLAQCRPQNLAVVIDVTWSFSAGDLATQVAAQRAFLQKMSKLPGTTVDLYMYGNIGGIGAPGDNPWTPDLATQNFNISTPEGLAAANAVLDGITNERRNANADTSWFSAGTNWEAGLRDVLKGINESGRNYTNVIFSSDGAPNKTLSDSGEWEDPGVYGYWQPAADEALRYAHEILDKGIKIAPVFVRSAEDYLSIIQLDQREPGTLQLALDAIGKLSGAESPELGKDYFSAETMDGLTGDLWRAAIADCSPANNPKPTPPAEPDYEQFDTPAPAPAVVQAPVGSYQLTELSAPIPVVDKVADGEGKKVLAGETTTQTVSYATGYEVPSSFVIGDHIYKTEDGRLPVSVDMSKVAVTDAEGNNVTADFTITQEDGTLGGKAGVQILATAKDPASLKLNHTYTLHVNQTSLFDGVADTLQDAGFSITNDEIQFTDIKTYHEPKLNPDKTVVNSVGVEVDGTKVLLGAELSYELTLSAADLTNTIGDVTVLGMVDDYDETKWQPNGKFTVKDSEGKDVDADKFTYEDKDGVITVLAKNPGELVGKDYSIILYGMVKWDAKPGSFSNQATQLTNQDKIVTKVVTNYVPVITPSKVETSPVNGANLDGKTLMVGDVINYTLVEDTTDLVNSSENISQSGMKDDYDESAGEIDLSAVKVYQVPADTDTSTPEATAAAIKAAGAVEVTDSYDFTIGTVEGFTNGGAEGYTGFMKTSGEGEAKKVVLPMGYKYIHILPYTVTANVDGEIKNTAWQVTNGVEAQTQTVANPMKKIQPSKDVSIEVGGASVDGGTLALGQVFNYKLTSSDLPSDRVKNIDSWTLVDDYDETKDEYRGNYLAQARFDLVDESGKTVIKAGADITAYITQDWDEAAGKTTFSANDELLELINLDENKGKTAGFEVFMQAKRIGTGEIVNTVTEFVNGQEIIADSDTVTPDDPNGPTTVITHTYDSDLKVDKEWVDADASDGKVSARISGTNVGQGTALGAKLSDDVFKGLGNPTIVDVQNGTSGQYTAESTALVFEQVATGDVVSMVLEFDVVPGAKVLDNTASFENEFDKAGDPDNIQENDGLEADTDQRDKVSLEIPEAPVTPVTPEAGKNTPVIKGEGARTGGEASVAGLPVGGLVAAGGVLLAGLAAIGAWALVHGARKKNS
ncbi:hypothetical protein E4U03_07625 [Rothia nasimurium]|uniref:VWFA domain-containing protein n=1 Tax=Rothia nasimurium TaxID=85336 RepID=A0A4Y9F2R8_9MICC|nr:LPXTG cell wall anchor domain-containing protein [Rothia nasimurium]MBF0808478.1 LPXTG cell wall anchor domain-containing protein [Rothia nasimurium]TFU21970.1 hypothetical protein E4U03_07625 [Rothia nasimurium]